MRDSRRPPPLPPPLPHRVVERASLRHDRSTAHMIRACWFIVVLRVSRYGGNLKAGRLATKLHMPLADHQLASARFGHTFQNEMLSFKSEARRVARLSNRPESCDFGGLVNGANLAMVVGMDNRTATRKVDGLSFMRVIRGFAEGALVALGFALAILLIGTPLALLARGVHEGLSWLVRLRGETSALMEALVTVSSVLGTVILVAVFVRLLVGFSNWRRRFRARGRSGRAANARSNPHKTARAA